MNLTEQIRGNFPKTIDKSKPVFSSLIVNSNSDAAIQKQLVYLFDYMKEWISTPDIYEQTGTMLDKTVTFFSFLERFTDEKESSLKNRFAAIFIRNHDTKWGTPFDVKSVFKQYFPSATIYLVENVNKINSTEPGLANLLLDGDINTDTPSDWSLVNCSASPEARFSKAYGILFNQTEGELSQSVNVASESTYFLHFFLKGQTKVSIKDNNNKYWDFASKTWSNDVKKTLFSTDVKNTSGIITSYEWDNRSLYFITQATTSSVTITFEEYGVGNKAETNVVFTRSNDIEVLRTETIIPSGTRVKTSSNKVFITTQDAYIEPNHTESNEVNVIAENFGYDYQVAANTITIIDSSVPDEVISVDNSSQAIGGTFIDYFRLFAKQPYSTFTVIAHFEGNTASKAFGLAAGNADPNMETEESTPPQPRYGNYGYYDKSFLSGVPIGFASDIYEDLLDYLRAQGVRAFLDIVIKDYASND